MLDQAAKLVIDVAFGLVVYSLIGRFLMQLMRAPFRNPIGQAVVALTVKPGRRYKLLATADLSLPHDSWMVADEFEVTADNEGGPTEIVLKGPLVANAARLFFAAEVDLAGAEAP